MTDDQRWDNLGCYGRPEFRTDNIDRLAERGVTFDKAYYAVSICMPSRATMMTGRYLSSHRAGFSAPNNKTISRAEFADSYPAQLKRAGYRTGFIGKFGYSVTREKEGTNLTKKDDYHMKEEVGDVFDFFVDEHGTHTEGGGALWPEDDAELQAIYRDGRENSGRTPKTGEAMLRFIDTQPEDQPFCLSVSFWAVKHDRNRDIFTPDLDIFKNHWFSVPGNWVDGPNDKLPKVVIDNWRGYRLHVERTSTAALYQRQVRRFAAQGLTVDHQVGLLVDKLRQNGMLDNTVIIYTSDNGRFQGSHGLFDKALLYQESVRQPLIVFDGRKAAFEGGRRENALISSVDIAPTLLSLAGVAPPASMQGHSFTKVLDQTQDLTQWQDAVFMENLFLVSVFGKRNANDVDDFNAQEVAKNRSYRCRGVATERWKYFVYYEHDPVIEELYDLEGDPLEQQNLAQDPEHADLLKRLRAKTDALYQRAIH